MATKAQIMSKIRQMAKEQNKTLIKECKRLLNSGGVNTENVDLNYNNVPRSIFHVALLNEANQYQPHTTEAKDIVKNLKHF